MISSTPSRVLLVTVHGIDRVDDSEIFFGHLHGEQMYGTNEVRIKTSTSGVVFSLSLLSRLNQPLD